MHITISKCAVAFAAAVVFLTAGAAMACPFCSAPSLTLSEQVEQSDAVALVKWTDGTKPDDERAGSTEYEVIEVVRNTGDPVGKGDKITLARYRSGQPGDLLALVTSGVDVSAAATPPPELPELPLISQRSIVPKVKK